jgi:hypothetical protein
MTLGRLINDLPNKSKLKDFKELKGLKVY